MNISRGAIVVGAGLLGFGLSVVPAQARPLSVDNYSFSDSGSFRDCGFRVDFASNFSGIATVKNATPKTAGQFFYFSDRYRIAETYTNHVTGKFITVDAHGNFRELQPSVVSDDGRIVRYMTKDSGAFQTIFDSEGRVLYRDRGTVVTEYTFDTFGDGQPGGEILSADVVRVSGPHPVWEQDGCDFFTEVLG